MANCHEMRKGDVYYCADCGLEVQVTAECKDVGKPVKKDGCCAAHEDCTLTCCGQELVKK